MPQRHLFSGDDVRRLIVELANRLAPGERRDIVIAGGSLLALLRKSCADQTLGRALGPTTVVGVTGLEPGTSTMSRWRSNQLSYTPESD